MNPDSVKNSIENIDTRINSFIEVVNTRMGKAEAQESALIATFTQGAEIRVDLLTLPITRMVHGLAQRANYTIIRVTFHASPEIVTLILAMVWIYRAVTVAITIFNILKIIGTVWQINQIIMEVWPQYKKWFNSVLVKVSEMSGYIGWGVDGIGHLINACAGGINIVGGLMGKSWPVMQAEIMERANELIGTLGRGFQSIQADPGMWLNALFEGRTLLSADAADDWWSPIAKGIALTTIKAENAIKGVQGVIGELSAIQNDMPDVVRQNIPASIWSSLDKADSMINDNILPRFTQIQNSLQWINAIQGATIKRIGELVDRLAHPGEVLLGVDDLPDYVKNSQLNMIDDVTSREFEFWTDQERTELSPDLDEFDRIDRLATAATPEPAYFSLEIPEGRTVRGITAEHKETWFVGNY